MIPTVRCSFTISLTTLAAGKQKHRARILSYPAYVPAKKLIIYKRRRVPQESYPGNGIIPNASAPLFEITNKRVIA
ncbi:hypothetical protein IQ07DRAFT_166598 [Pyrenochaeta sp. DS3sAY3a]|nr:hypothetical protein IQ07DRAFT_166598 [Pyrenochaeta sp. DS3sAY3a]